MSLTVSELLALEGLSALRLRAGKQGLQRAVRWYYVAENEHIAEWIMGGELVFITGINHPRDEANLIQLLMEGKQRGIAGMVILTGEAYIHAIPATLIALADELGIPLIEQPYLLKMVIVTERIGTAVLIMTVNPGFGGQKFIPYTLEKVKQVRAMCDAKGLNTDIQVDGGVSAANVREVLEAGANVFVAGSAVFGSEPAARVKEFNEIFKEYEK